MCVCRVELNWVDGKRSQFEDVFLLQDPLIPAHFSTLDDVLSLSLALSLRLVASIFANAMRQKCTSSK